MNDERDRPRRPRRPVRVGVIGIGYGQQVLVPAFRADDRCVVAGICASTKERAGAVAERLGISFATGDWRDITTNTEIDAVAIAVPPVLQVEIARSAVANGKHVFCEKPVGVDAADVAELLKAADTAGVTHAVDFMFPEIPVWQKARELIAGGAIGPVRHANLVWRVETYAHRTRSDSWKLRPAEGGGTLSSFVSHALYNVEWLLGPIEKVVGRIMPAGSIEDVLVDAWLALANGAAVSISAATNAFPGSGFRLEIYGGDGAIVLVNEGSDYVNGFRLQVATREKPTWETLGTSDALNETRLDRMTPHKDGRIDGVRPIVRRFIDAIETGGVVRPNLSDGLRVQSLIERIRGNAEPQIPRRDAPRDDRTSAELDIVIPVYNEAENIVPVLESLRRSVRTPFRVLICYDRDDDNTLPAVRAYDNGASFEVAFVKNTGRGALGAVLSGFAASRAPAVLVFPADDDYNAPRIDVMMESFRRGNEIVVGSRFIPGGYMRNCPPIKGAIVRWSARVLHFIARLPTRDPSNGLRLFSRRVLDQIEIESTSGFAYSIELLVKAHRLGWPISEVAIGWEERKAGRSRFAVFRWLPQYWVWFRYAFATTFLRRSPQTVPLRVRGPQRAGAAA